MVQPWGDRLPPLPLSSHRQQDMALWSGTDGGTVTPAPQRVNSSQFHDTLVNASQRETDLQCNSMLLADFFPVCDPHSPFCSSAILPGIDHFVLDFILLSSYTFLSTNLHYVHLRSSVSSDRMALQLVQSH